MARLFGEGSAAGMDEGELLRRFALGRDPMALEVLVARHGPMVLGVCRRILGDRHSSEDAFQATFLVLAQRAGSIRDPDRLGPWLHGVAQRVAVRARAGLARRNSRERPGAEELAVETSADDSGCDRLELRAALDEEVRRLPEKFREPIVLCYLDGLTHDEAARRLRCPVGTVRSRLSTARAKLHERLTRRGVAAPSVAFAMMLAAEGAQAATSPALLSSTVKAATATAFAGGMAAAAAGMVPVGVASLAEGVSKAMILSKLKIVGGLALAAMLTLGVGAVSAYQAGSKGQDAKAEKPAEEKAKTAETGPKLDEAVKAAEAYLDLLDEGKYAESWDAMSAAAREAIDRAGWAEKVGKVRTATGKLKARKLKRLDLRSTGAADRFDHAWLYAESRAARGGTWSELVILTFDKGKGWGIDTYMIGDPTKLPKPPAE